MSFGAEMKDFVAGFQTGFSLRDKAKDRAWRERLSNAKTRGLTTTDYDKFEKDRTHFGEGAKHGPGNPEAPSTSTETPQGGDVGDAKANNVLAFIRQREAGTKDPYNTILGGGKADLSNMTLAQVRDMQTKMINDGRESSAVGAYQFIRGTLDGVVGQLGLDPNTTKFTPEVQDKLAFQLMKNRGWGDPKVSQEKLMHNLSQEWASLPKDASGASFYEGVGSNKSGATWDQFAKAFEVDPNAGTGTAVAAAAPRGRKMPKLAIPADTQADTGDTEQPVEIQQVNWDTDGDGNAEPDEDEDDTTGLYAEGGPVEKVVTPPGPTMRSSTQAVAADAARPAVDNGWRPRMIGDPSTTPTTAITVPSTGAAKRFHDMVAATHVAAPVEPASNSSSLNPAMGYGDPNAYLTAKQQWDSQQRANAWRRSQENNMHLSKDERRAGQWDSPANYPSRPFMGYEEWSATQPGYDEWYAKNYPNGTPRAAARLSNSVLTRGFAAGGAVPDDEEDKPKRAAAPRRAIPAGQLVSGKDYGSLDPGNVSTINEGSSALWRLDAAAQKRAAQRLEKRDQEYHAPRKTTKVAPRATPLPPRRPSQDEIDSDKPTGATEDLSTHEAATGVTTPSPALPAHPSTPTPDSARPRAVLPAVDPMGNVTGAADEVQYAPYGSQEPVVQGRGEVPSDNRGPVPALDPTRNPALDTGPEALARAQQVQPGPARPPLPEAVTPQQPGHTAQAIPAEVMERPADPPLINRGPEGRGEVPASNRRTALPLRPELGGEPQRPTLPKPTQGPPKDAAGTPGRDMDPKPWIPQNVPEDAKGTLSQAWQAGRAMVNTGTESDEPKRRFYDLLNRAMKLGAPHSVISAYADNFGVETPPRPKQAIPGFAEGGAVEDDDYLDEAKHAKPGTIEKPKTALPKVQKDRREAGAAFGAAIGNAIDGGGGSDQPQVQEVKWDTGYAAGGAVEDDEEPAPLPVLPEGRKNAAPADVQAQDRAAGREYGPPIVDKEAARESTRAGLKYINDVVLSPKPQRAVGPDPAAGDAQQKFDTNDHALTNQEMKALGAKVDPEGKLDEGDRILKAQQDMYDWYMANGYPEKAAGAAASVLMYGRRVSQMSGTMALAAVQEGDLVAASKWMAKAYDTMPNGQHLKVDPAVGQDGKLGFQVCDSEGNVIDEGRAGAEEMGAMAQKMQSGAAWAVETQRMAQEGGLTKKGTGGSTYTEQRDQSRSAAAKAVADAGKAYKADPSDENLKKYNDAKDAATAAGVSSGALTSYDKRYAPGEKEGGTAGERADAAADKALKVKLDDLDKQIEAAPDDGARKPLMQQKVIATLDDGFSRAQRKSRGRVSTKGLDDWIASQDGMSEEDATALKKLVPEFMRGNADDAATSAQLIWDAMQPDTALRINGNQVQIGEGNYFLSGNLFKAIKGIQNAKRKARPAAA